MENFKLPEPSGSTEVTCSPLLQTAPFHCLKLERDFKGGSVLQEALPDKMQCAQLTSNFRQ